MAVSSLYIIVLFFWEANFCFNLSWKQVLWICCLNLMVTNWHTFVGTPCSYGMLSLHKRREEADNFHRCNDKKALGLAKSTWWVMFISWIDRPPLLTSMVLEFESNFTFKCFPLNVELIFSYWLSTIGRSDLNSSESFLF
jgi:hypothetical protein